MPRPSPTHLLLLLPLLRTALASTSLQSLQPVVGFTDPCISAYSSTISSCSNTDFAGIGGTGFCSSQCVADLTTLQTQVQQACSGQQADGSSLIGHLFLGSGVQLLCGSAANAATSSGPSVASSTATSSSSAAAASTTTSTSESSASSTTLKSRTTLSPSTSTITSTAAASTTTTLTAATSTSSSSSTTKQASAQQTVLNNSGGGSPFDINVSSSATSAIHGRLETCWSVLLVGSVGLFLLLR